MSIDSPDRRPTATGVPNAPDTTDGHGIDAVPTRIANPITPQRIGPYEIIRTLGRGGMSTVYLARDERDGGEVALKVIPGGPEADPTDLARFREEADAVSRLNHPNIVRLYEVGEDTGVAYLAMEYVAGGNLFKHISHDGRLPIREAAELLEPLARAAHYAHTQGIIHRDLKPSNILLAAGDPHSAISRSRDRASPLTPKIADFGLAKQLNKSLRLTQSGVALGTPHYMAPEQARGEGDRVGPSADVYALGAILYECLTGHPPFGASSPLETMEQVVHKKPIPPSQLRDGIPPDLEAICLRCLEKSPSKRFPAAGAMADALLAYLSGQPIVNADHVPTERIVIRRRPLWQLTVASTVVGLMLMALAAWVTWVASNLRHGEVERTQQAETEAARRAEHRTRLEEAIARCERGDIASGLERMRTLAGDDDLPIAEIVAAWESRILTSLPVPSIGPADVLAISSTGEYIAASNGATVRVWNRADGNPIGGAWEADAPVTALTWAAGTNRLAVGTESGRVSVGNGESAPFAPQSLVDPAGNRVTAITAHNWGFGVTFGATPAIRWIEDDQPPTTEELPPISSVASVAFGPHGGLAVVTVAGSVKLFDPDNRRWLDLPPDGDASAIAFAIDGNALAVGTRAGGVRLWDAVARVPLTDSIAMSGPITAVAVGMTTTHYTVFASNGKATAGWTSARPFVAAPIRLPMDPGQDILGFAFSSNAGSLYVTSPAGVSIWRLIGGRELDPAGRVVPRDRYSMWVGRGKFSSAIPVKKEDGSDSLLIAGSRGRLFQVDPAKGESNLSARSVDNEVTSVAIDKNGRVCAFCGKNKEGGARGHLWSHGLADAVEQDVQFDSVVRQSAFLPDASAVVLGCDDGLVHIWDPVAGRDERPPFNCKSPVLAIAVDEAGKHILAGCADGTAHLWELATGSELQVVRQRTEIRVVAFHGDDLLTASAHGNVRRWHAATGLPLGPPMPHTDAVTALATHGSMVATGGRDHFVRVWRLP
ncbi:MAG TPA: WD40 repeat domain-containing serine/threonine-protein kinase [Gemmataceae bacterium]|jgi:serine/threonine protein kinase/WD40 repeat protein|nr:WD40 repeat domain-containing serine/threonine-protein kinase [Gemmataceae bacterium]